MSNLINIIRINFGQYWLEEFEPWDSRTEPLGNYFNSRLRVSWSKDGGDSWHKFEISEKVIELTSMIPSEKSLQQLITEEDFEKLTRCIQEGFEPSFSASFLTSAHRLFDEGRIKYSFIEAVLSLELAIREFVKSKITISKEISDVFNSFWNLPIRAQMILLSKLQTNISNSDLELSLKAIDWRNRIVHEGFVPPENDSRECIYALLRTISALLDGPNYKFPRLNIGNRRDK